MNKGRHSLVLMRKRVDNMQTKTLFISCSEKVRITLFAAYLKYTYKNTQTLHKGK